MKNLRLLLISFVMCSVMSVKAGDFLKQFVKSDSGQKFFVGIVEEKQKQLEELKKEQADIFVSNKAVLEKIARQVQEIKTILVAVDTDLKTHANDEYLIKKQSILKESEQVLKDSQRTIEDGASLLQELISQLTTFVEDAEFEGFKKKHKLQERLYYSFEDLQKLHEYILDYERRVVQLTEQEKTLHVEKESRKRNLALVQEEHEKRMQDIQVAAESIPVDTAFGRNIQNEKDLLRLDEHMLKYKKQLCKLRIKEISYKIMLAELQLFIVKTHLDLFKKQLRSIKSSVHVSEVDVLLAEEELAKEQRNYFVQKDALRIARDKIIVEEKKKEKELVALSKQYGIALGSDLDEWSKLPKQTADSYISLAHIGSINTEVRALIEERISFDAQIAFLEENYKHKETDTDVKKTFLKVSTRGFLTEEEIANEQRKYEKMKKDREEEQKVYQTKINALTNSLNQLKKVLDRINALHESAQKQKEVIFRGKMQDYTPFEQYLNHAERVVKKQIDSIGKLTGVYSGIISELNSAIRLIDFILSELQASTIWYRPAYAITLDGIKNIISDSHAFFNDVRIYISHFTFKIFVSYITDLFMSPLDLLLFIAKVMLLLVALFLMRHYESEIAQFCFVTSRLYGSLISILCFFIGSFVRFVSMFYRMLFVWFFCWLIINMIPDHYMNILFYLGSIPYLLYLSNRFLRLFMVLNNEYDHMFLSEDFQRRFELVFGVLLYVSLSILLYRQAFMLSSVYLRSELPNILLAVNFIILQISLIFLITKEQIMGIIPERTDFWRWVYMQVDHYYYLILLFVIAVIIMSNPYVGFGRLVWYLLSSFMYMALLFKVLSVCHAFVKKLTSILFFVQDEAILRERFSYAKTCFGLVIITSFVILGFIGFIASAKIWGWDVGFADLKQWLAAPLLLEGTTTPITTMSLLKLIGYVFGGFAAAYALKEYVLARIFDLLLVESGVQHTVTSIIQYVVIVIAVFIGFHSVGLGSLIGSVFIALALSIGLYIKDPISDFVSYFIILVQRPIKIGDYVQIDEETMGVVRKITPRAVILRRKNSTTIVVPNSYLVSKSIENWNYVRNFIAINDIILFVYFKEDPQRVKELLHQAVDEHPKVLKNPCSIVRLNNFTECGYEFMVRAFISSAYTLEMWDIGSDIRILIAKKFKENNVDFAIPMYKIDEIGHHYESKFVKDRFGGPHTPPIINKKE